MAEGKCSGGQAEGMIHRQDAKATKGRRGEMFAEEKKIAEAGGAASMRSLTKNE